MALTPRGYALGARNALLFDHPKIALHVATLPEVVGLPTQVNLAAFLPAPFDQGSQGSCVACAHVTLMMMLQGKLGQKVFMGARAFTYWLARKRECLPGKLPETDDGCVPQDALASLVDEGMCSDADMPYHETDWTSAPGKKQYYDAKHHLLRGALVVPLDLGHLKSVLAAGFPFTIAVEVFPSFEVAPNGVVPMPGLHEMDLGGHDVICYGYADAPHDAGGGRFLFQNSWGGSWGASGCGTIPYAYLLDPRLAYQATSGTSIQV